MDQKTLSYLKSRVEKALEINDQIERYKSILQSLEAREIDILSFRIISDMTFVPSTHWNFRIREDQNVLETAREAIRNSLEKDVIRLQKELDEF